MKIKMKESTKQKYLKLHKEGLLDKLLIKVIKSIDDKTDAEMTKILKSAPEREKKHIKAIQKDPQAYIKNFRKELGLA